MKRYFRNLSEHPGLEYATIFSALGTVAGLQRDGTLRSAIMGTLIMSVFWIPVLITSRR